MKVFNTLALISVCAALPAYAAGSAANASNSAAAAQPQQSQVAQTETSANVQSGAIYDRHGQPVTAMQVGKARAAEAAVKKAGVAPDSTEAAMIRIGAGQSPETAYEPFDGIYDAEGNRISSKQAAEELAVEEVIRRSGAEPGSEREAIIRAAAGGEDETDEGDEVDGETMEEVAKEIAVQQAILRTGVQPGSANESLIRMGADVMMDRYKSWK
ncbi:hypothetical protein [Zhongshania aliphaticivorans]|uniref:hypothetical protein n=1 Tax=Zhongshania aliphaticivorans TaxID=1470434 RepID=UPI0012E59600|nr:hypothetical protein [Zhongshania aliphaticivorans]MBU0539822.1 hypothetical protein [Gammaproteobacteria bacterium]MBU1832555.1 hypothetical protein [Gammaproteobacteria bacterium]CAA0092066.1 Uncharacterised protein [Zhongshania aliphaticivorans]